ncbi:MAG: hypothetical protein QXS37_03385 [Candidatus Aenigmatarchaeota archaeon]
MNACTVIPTSIESFFSTFYTLVLLLMVVIIGFIYMLSKILKELSGIARAELSQLYISVFIGIFSILLAQASCEILSSYIENKYGIIGPGGHFFVAYSYMNSLVMGEKGGVVTSTQLFATAFSLSFASKLFKLSESGLELKPFAVLEFFVIGIKFILNLFYSFLIISLQIQAISIYAAKEYSFSLFLPIGLILRVIPITRSAGSFLIALAFGLYVVWPTLFVFEYDVTQEILKLKGEEVGKEVESFFEENPQALFNKNDPSHTIEVLKKSLRSTDILKDLFKIYSKFSDIAMVLVPQATILGVINFTILIAFVSSLGDFIKSL